MKIMGHRGARDKAPENTLRSFAALLESNTPAVEFDIHELKDGTWLVHHDDTLNRTTTGEGFLQQKTWADLQSVQTKEGDPLPRLEEVLRLFRPSQVELQIEVKSPGDFKKLGALLKSEFDVERITVISFNHKWLLDFKCHHPGIKTTCLLFALPVDPVQIAKSAQADGISLNVHWIDEEVVRQCHKENLTVTAWNANDIDIYLKMKEIQVDYLGTDIPFTAQTWR